jgi:hypothetical protein
MHATSRYWQLTYYILRQSNYAGAGTCGGARCLRFGANHDVLRTRVQESGGLECYKRGNGVLYDFEFLDNPEGKNVGAGTWDCFTDLPPTLMAQKRQC